jgi:hypothetical protein
MRRRPIWGVGVNAELVSNTIADENHPFVRNAQQVSAEYPGGYNRPYYWQQEINIYLRFRCASRGWIVFANAVAIPFPLFA